MDVEACLEQLDQLFAYQKLNDVEPYLLGCVQEALQLDRPDAVLTFINELIGYYRSVSRHEDALTMSQAALNWITQFHYQGGLPHATTLVNAATAFRAAGLVDEAIGLYDQALILLDQFPLEEIAYQKASLYNNLSLAYQAKGQDQSAIDALLTALQLLPNESVETAISYVNLAACYYHLDDNEAGFKASQKAVALFQALNETSDAHYASALASLADGYARKGDFEYASRINAQAIQYQLDSFGANDDYRLLVAKQADFLKQAGHPASLPNVYPEKMSGLALSQAYYERFGRSALQHHFGKIVDQLAVGLVGMGSECLGLDDEWSTDHDYGPGFCLFVPQALYQTYGRQLEQFYQQLPKRFMGLERQETLQGKGRTGVVVMEQFFYQLTGCPYGPVKLTDWLGIEESYLLCASNGAVFDDPSGAFHAVYDKIKAYYPADVYYKKLAATLAKMARDGQYQYARCMFRHDLDAAWLYVQTFVQETLQLLFLLNRQYMPYTKWQFKLAQQLPLGQSILLLVKQLMRHPDVDVSLYPANAPSINLADPRVALIESIAKETVSCLQQLHLSNASSHYLEDQAKVIFQKIQDPVLASMHLMED